MNDQPSERPAHRCARELRTRIGRLTHILTPHVSTRLAPVAANAHVHNRGTPPAGHVRQTPDHRLTRNALTPAALTPPVLTSNTACQHCMVCLNALTRHLQPQAIQARERAQVQPFKERIRLVKVAQINGLNLNQRKTTTLTKARHDDHCPPQLRPQLRKAIKPTTLSRH